MTIKTEMKDTKGPKEICEEMNTCGSTCGLSKRRAEGDLGEAEGVELEVTRVALTLDGLEEGDASEDLEE
jgi:hypothetical protein